MAQVRQRSDRGAPAPLIAVRPTEVPSAVDRLAHALDASLPEIYDFACRLLRTTAGAEEAVTTAVQRALEMPAALTSSERFRSLALAQVYRWAKARIGPPDSVSTGLFTRGSPAVLATMPCPSPTGGPLVWDATTALSFSQYAALHLHTRAALAPAVIAEVLGVSPTHTLVLLHRAHRCFAESLSVQLLLSLAPDACPFLTDLHTRQPAFPEAQMRRRLRYHLATGCPVCRQQVQTAGLGTDGGAALLAALAPAPVPAGLETRLRRQVLAKAAALAALSRATEEAAMNTSPQRHLRRLPFPGYGKSKHRRALAVLAGAPALLLGAVLALLSLAPGPKGPAPAGLPGVRISVQTSGGWPAGGETVFQIDRSGLPTPAVASPTPGAMAAGPSAIAPDAGLTPWTAATPQGRAAPQPPTTSSDATVVILNPPPVTITSNVGETTATPPPSATPQSRAASTLPSATADATVVILNPGPMAGPGTAAPATPAAAPSLPQPPPPPPPRLVVSGEVVTFTRGETVKTVSLSNAGEGEIRWHAETRQPWIVVSPAAGTLTGTATLQIRVNRELAPRGPQQGSVSISSSAGTIIVTVVSE